MYPHQRAKAQRLQRKGKGGRCQIHLPTGSLGFEQLRNDCSVKRFHFPICNYTLYLGSYMLLKKKKISLPTQSNLAKLQGLFLDWQGPARRKGRRCHRDSGLKSILVTQALPPAGIQAPPLSGWSCSGGTGMWTVICRAGGLGVCRGSPGTAQLSRSPHRPGSLQQSNKSRLPLQSPSGRLGAEERGDPRGHLPPAAFPCPLKRLRNRTGNILETANPSQVVLLSPPAPSTRARVPVCVRRAPEQL